MMSTATPPPDSICPDDFEEVIHSYMVRRRSSSDGDTFKRGKHKHHEKIYDYLPLLLCDLKGFVPCGRNGSNHVYGIFGGQVKFRNCLVYGRIVRKPMEYRSAYKYWLDDGTAIFPILVSRQCRQQRWLTNELLQLKRHHASHERPLAGALRNLVVSSMEELLTRPLELGTRVLVSGKPYRFRREWTLTVWRLQRDTETTGQLEMAFTDSLIDWYDEKLRCT